MRVLEQVEPDGGPRGKGHDGVEVAEQGQLRVPGGQVHGLPQLTVRAERRQCRSQAASAAAASSTASCRTVTASRLGPTRSLRRISACTTCTCSASRSLDAERLASRAASRQGQLESDRREEIVY